MAVAGASCSDGVRWTNCGLPFKRCGDEDEDVDDKAAVAAALWRRTFELTSRGRCPRRSRDRSIVQ